MASNANYVQHFTLIQWILAKGSPRKMRWLFSYHSSVYKKWPIYDSFSIKKLIDINKTEKKAKRGWLKDGRMWMKIKHDRNEDSKKDWIEG